MTGTFRIGWGAAVKGKRSDIARWKAALKQPFEPWVESHDDKTVLHSETFDGLESANDVRDRAVYLIGRLNGAMAVSRDSGPLSFYGVTEFMSDGTRNQTLFAEFFDEMDAFDTVDATVTRPDGQPIPPPPPTMSDVQAWVALAESNVFLDDAFIYFGTATEWFDIYKTLETLILEFGAGKKEKQREQAFLSLAWAPKEDIERLKQTANWARHAKRKFMLPQDPMKLPEARRLLGQLLRRALSEASAP